MTKKQLIEPRIVEEKIEGFGTVHLRLLTAGEVFDLESQSGDPREQMLGRIASCVVDGDGVPLFADASEVSAMAWSTVRAISRAILAANGLGGDGGAEKNSPAPPGSD